MHIRRTGRLHAHRWSAPGARYFVTCCSTAKHSGLLDIKITERILAAVRDTDGGNDNDTIAMTVMPDHVHWLFALGGRLSLGRVVARMKSRTKPALSERGMGWQRDFFERRLRSDESSQDYAFYIFMNPYRAGLIADAPWPFWWSAHPEQLDFLALLNADGSPPPEWLDAPPPGIHEISS